MEIDENLIFNQIRKYNQARRIIYKDQALLRVGIHVGLLKRRMSVTPELTQEERDRVLYFLRQFVTNQGCEVEIAG